MWICLAFGDAAMLSTQLSPGIEALFLIRPCIVLSPRFSPRFKPFSITKSETDPKHEHLPSIMNADRNICLGKPLSIWYTYLRSGTFRSSSQADFASRALHSEIDWKREKEEKLVRFPQYLLQPIPHIKPSVDWKNVSIQENGERLVALSSLHEKGISLDAHYFQRGLPGALKELYTRESIAEKLLQAVSFFPLGYTLLLWDAWRPLAVQQALFDAQCQVVRAQFPALTEQEVQEQAQIYVYAPSTSVACPSPHYTGGSIDLTILDPEGTPLPMGTAFDTFDSRSRTRALEELVERGRQLTAEEQKWREHRRVLCSVMTSVGFTYDWEEWWHFDYGNQSWGAVTGRDAIYNGISP